jgi:hypothetical protein
VIRRQRLRRQYPRKQLNDRRGKERDFIVLDAIPWRTSETSPHCEDLHSGKELTSSDEKNSGGVKPSTLSSPEEADQPPDGKK